MCSIPGNNNKLIVANANDHFKNLDERDAWVTFIQVTFVHVIFVQVTQENYPWDICPYPDEIRMNNNFFYRKKSLTQKHFWTKNSFGFKTIFANLLGFVDAKSISDPIFLGTQNNSFP